MRISWQLLFVKGQRNDALCMVCSAAVHRCYLLQPTETEDNDSNTCTISCSTKNSYAIYYIPKVHGFQLLKCWFDSVTMFYILLSLCQSPLQCSGNKCHTSLSVASTFPAFLVKLQIQERQKGLGRMCPLLVLTPVCRISIDLENCM